jgi:hypothetical protein
VLEELDTGGEYFTAAGKLYIKPNVTGTAWQDEVVVGVSERLVSLVGSQESPVQHVQFHGITFTQSLPRLPIGPQELFLGPKKYMYGLL